MILALRVTRPDEYEAFVQISGFFTIDENEPNKEQLINENAVAVLYPYARSEMTLLTAQPETEPIVLPVMNIVEMIKASTSKRSYEE